MKDFANGWSGLKEYAVKVGVANVDDNDDTVAAKIKSVIQGTLSDDVVRNEDGTPAEAEGGNESGPIKESPTKT